MYGSDKRAELYSSREEGTSIQRDGDVVVSLRAINFGFFGLLKVL